ncbi:glycosyltransferase [Paraconexibacter antarcticus]|uniref:Glycosyltransferase n=1 Tax=Paraconexibacter antarcticus TaxID=2949664 RepID=A0ABY5DUS2_9ACTN|nr:glycosyltransferase [Paraconexibacter antarcticus]UTI64452.1 glycosyltransferase [Paraconexibacter antarcticus]
MPKDVLLVALGSTAGLRRAEAGFAASLARAGVSVATVTAAPQRDVRTLMATDLVWALAARRAAVAGIAEHAPRAVVYSTVTAALLWPRPGAIRFDAPAAGNRPGRHGLWQRPLERRRLAAAPLLLPHDAAALDDLGPAAAAALRGRVVAVPIAVDPSGPADGVRDLATITYGTNPHKKGLDRVLAAWALARRPGEELLVAGIDALPDGLGPAPEGVRCTGMLDAAAYRGLLRRARVFVTAPRREDHGLAQLEALADGCALVTTAAPGPYAALPAARALDPRWVLPDGAGADALAAAIRTALDDPPADLAVRGPAAVAEHGSAAIDRAVAERVLPRLLG